MDDVTPGRPGRRTVLRWPAAAFGVLLIDVATEAPARAATPDGSGAISLTPASSGVATVLGPAGVGAVTTPTDLGVVLTSPSAIGAGTTVTFTFTPQVYDLFKVPLARTSSGGVLPVTLGAVTEDPSRNVRSVTATLGAAVPAGTSATVILGQVRPHRFPFDLTRQLGAATAEAVERSKGARSSHAMAGAAKADAASKPWGGRASALWQPVTWGDGYRTFVPLSASVTSIGPEPIAAGYTLQIRVDGAVATGLGLGAATDMKGQSLRGDGRRRDAHGMIVLEWTAAAALPVGAMAMLRLTTDVRPLSGPISTLRHPVVQFLAPAGASPAQRTTFSESVTRRDSIVDDESRQLWAVS